MCRGVCVSGGGGKTTGVVIGNTPHVCRAHHPIQPHGAPTDILHDNG